MDSDRARSFRIASLIGARAGARGQIETRAIALSLFISIPLSRCRGIQIEYNISIIFDRHDIR